MTISASQFDRQRHRSRRGQSGFGLLEAIIGMVMVALMIGAGATGLQTLRSTSGGANQIARLDTLLVGASEAIRETQYIDCAPPEAYRDAILAADAARPQDKRLLQTTASGTPTIAVTGVAADGCGTTAGDPGRQMVTLTATLNGKTRTADVLKIDPTRRLKLPTAKIDPPVELTAAGDIQAVFSLTATQSKSELGLRTFEWDCGPKVVDGSEQTATFFNDNDQKFCKYQADTVDRVVRVTLKVTDVNDQSDDTFVDLTIKARTDPRPPPIAQASGTPTSISPGQTVVFSSAGSAAPSGSIASYNWGFDDPSSGFYNNSWNANPSHTFYQSGTFNVTLTITDEVGLTSTASVSVTVTPIPVPLPTAKFDQPGGPYYAPASVSVDGSGSKDSAGADVVGYEWDFGDGKPKGFGPTTTHIYNSPGTWIITLTVEDSGGRKSTTTQQVVVRRMDAPGDFKAIGSRYQIPKVCFLGFCNGYRTGYMDFGWTKLTPGPDETLSIDIRIVRGTGVSPCWQNTVDRTAPQNQESGYQTYRWEEPSVAIGFDKTFCAGTNYEYMWRVRKVSPNGTSTGPWSTTRYWRV